MDATAFRRIIPEDQIPLGDRIRSVDRWVSPLAQPNLQEVQDA